MNRRVRWALLATVWLLPVSVQAQSVALQGTLRQLTTDPSIQIDPAISGDLVVFTDARNGNDDVYYVDLVTGAEVQVTSSPEPQRLQDVSGDVIVYTDYASGPDIYGYDVTSATDFAVATSPLQDENPAIDAGLVAFEQSDGFGARDVWTADLAAGTSAPIAVTPELESSPAVSGTRVAFERRATATAPSDVVVHDLATGAELVVAGTAADERRPDLDGDLLVWDAEDASGERDVYVHDLATGVTTRIDLPGNQAVAHVSGDFVAFDDDGQGNPDVVLYHVPTGTLHRFTAPTSAEFLNDVDGRRVVFTSDASGNFDIWLYEFTVDVGTPVCEPAVDPATVDACADASALTPVFEGTFERARGRPAVRDRSPGDDDDGADAPGDGDDGSGDEGASDDGSRHGGSKHDGCDDEGSKDEDDAPGADARVFAGTAGADGFVVVEDEGCASAWIRLDGEVVLTPDDLNAKAACLAIPVTLAEQNALEVTLASKPGCTLDVTVYEVPTVCSAPDTPPLLGCASGPGPVGLVALGLVLAALALRPRPQAVRVRRRRP